MDYFVLEPILKRRMRMADWFFIVAKENLSDWQYEVILKEAAVRLLDHSKTAEVIPIISGSAIKESDAKT